MTILTLLSLYPPFGTAAAVTPPVEPPPDEGDGVVLGYAVLTDAQGNKARLEVG